MMENFYVYILIDPRKLVMQPFYVGKGKNDRCYSHLSPSSSRRGHNRLKNGVIDKIRAAGAKVEIYKHTSNLTEEQAFQLEKQLIARFGRRNNSTGILTNLTDGGEGFQGRVYTEQQRQAISEKTKGENNPMYGKRHSSNSRLSASKTKKEGFASGKYKPTVHTDKHKAMVSELGKQSSKKVLKLDLDGMTIVYEYTSTTECCADLGLFDNSNFKNFGHSGCPPRNGFFYRFTDSSDYVDGKIQNVETLTKKRIELDKGVRHSRAVIKLNGSTIVSEFMTIQDAVNSNETYRYGALWQAIKHQRLYKGYSWSYS